MGLKINVSYDGSVTALLTSNPTLYAEYTAAVQTAVKYFESVITTPITLTINFGWGEVDGSPITGIGASAYSQYITTYAQLLAQAKATLTTSPVQLAALATLPATDPTNGAVIWITSADATALGFNMAGYDVGGSVGLSSSTTWAWTQNNIPAGASDAIGTLEHEISEVLGRSDEGGQNNEYSLLDMFRYTAADGQSTDPIGAAAGARDQPFVAGYNANAPSYFSYNGSTVTLPYETPADVAGGADVGDWASSVPNDSFGDAATTGTPDLVSPTDLLEMNAIGYTLAPSALPANYGGTGLSGVLMTSTATGALVLAQVMGGSESYQQIGGLGPEWSFLGSGDFLGDGHDGFLIENTSGAFVVGEDINGTAQYTATAGSSFGSGWSVVGTGQYAGGNQDEFMLRNATTGQLLVEEVPGGGVDYELAGGIGPEWTIEGSGDYLANAQSGILMENTSGTLVVGEERDTDFVEGEDNPLQYTAIGGIGPEWTIEATGNLLGHGQDDFLMRDTNNGALVVGEVVNGTAQYTAIGGVGSEWSFLGVGDYDGASNSELLMFNQNTGTLVVGTILNGTASYEQVGQVGIHDWRFDVAPT